MKKKKIKVAVIGYGGAFNMGRHHLTEMKAAGMEPVAVAEVDNARALVALQDFPAIQIFNDVGQMLTPSDVELITIIPPHNTHAALGLQCLTAGRLLEIKNHTFLVAVKVHEHMPHAVVAHRADVPDVVTARRFNLYDLRTEIAEDLGCIGTHDHRGQVDHGGPGERSGHQLRILGGMTQPFSRSVSSTQLRSSLPLPRMVFSIAASFLA